MTKDPSTARGWKPNRTIVTIIVAILVFAVLEILGVMPDRDTRRNILGGLAVIAVAGVGATWLVTVLAKRKRPAADGQADHPDTP
jgi:hypothetical protein